jgi:hypothetical protein
MQQHCMQQQQCRASAQAHVFLSVENRNPKYHQKSAGRRWLFLEQGENIFYCVATYEARMAGEYFTQGLRAWALSPLRAVNPMGGKQLQ